MNENKEKLLNLLADQTLFGLNEAEASELEKLKQEFPEFQDDNSFEFAAAAINLSGLEINEALPAHLQARILDSAEEFFASAENKQNIEYTPKTVAPARSEASGGGLIEEAKTPWWNWLGWGAAALACIALAVNLWLTRIQPKTEIARNSETTQTPTPAAPELTIEQKRRQFLASASDVVQTSWTKPDPKSPAQISGDVVWSDSRQKGYMRFYGLPANNPNKETYQLWIFDENQPEKYPVDGGVFDVSENGEVVIPIDAKINVKNPKMFAVTVEKPGGVVVSDRQKLVAIAKVQKTQTT